MLRESMEMKEMRKDEECGAAQSAGDDCERVVICAAVGSYFMLRRPSVRVCWGEHYTLCSRRVK